MTVVGLGPAGPELMTERARDELVSGRPVVLRTRRHPAAAVVAEAQGCDDLYEGCDSFEELYAAIASRVVDVARSAGSAVYAVPGSPVVAERSVEILLGAEGVEVEIVPALSFLDLLWAGLGVDPVGTGMTVVDGHSFEGALSGASGPVVVAQVDDPMVLSELKASVDPWPETPVVVAQRLGTAEQSIREVAWADLDREIEPDHLTSLYLRDLPVSAADALDRLDRLTRRLRRDCPWDQEQTHESLTRHLVEESYEVVEAIEQLDEDPNGYDHLVEELGDLLYQVYFHSLLGSEVGEFDIGDVARGIHDKLVTRHPHVFGEVSGEDHDAKSLTLTWEQAKHQEKERSSLMDGIPASLPALLAARKIQSRAASVGFDWSDARGPRSKISEELAELDAAEGGGVDEELGDLLFSIVNLARHLDVEPEDALRAANRRFGRRFALMEETAAGEGRTLGELSPDEMDSLWEKAKVALRGGPDRD